MSAEIFMASVSTDGHADSQAQSSLLRRSGEQAFTLTFLVVSAAATVGWLYVLGDGVVAITSWLFF
jgi:hypothetical protein